ETLRALVRASPLAIMALDPAGNVKTWNPAAERIFGWSIEEVLGRPLPIVPDEKQEEFLALRQRVLQGESYTGVEVRRKKRDGSPIEISISTAPLRDAHGEISGIMGVVADVTERKRMVEALIRRTRQLDALRAVGTEITRELDLPTLLGLIVRRAAELVGAASGTVFLWDERDQVLVAEAWHGFADWRRGVRLQLGEAVAGTTAQRREGMIVNDYRTSPYAHPVTLDRTGITAVLAEPLLYHDRLVGVLTINNEGTGRHFTEEDRATLALFATQAAIAIENARLYQEIQQHAAELEERVRERTRALDEASRHKSEFLANMSHELRTPLNSIIGFAEFLQEQRVGSLNEKQARYLGHIRASGQHLVQIIGDILDLSKAEAGRIVLQPESLSVATTLEDILVTTRGLAHQKNQIVEADIQPDLPPLWADPIRFKQILFNLLNNAVKFTPDGGQVALTARRVPGIADFKLQIADLKDEGPPLQSAIENLQSEIPRDFLEIAVTDTGIGIKTEDLPRLFQQFVQLEATATKHHEGTGLGLALAKRLVELHGGRIWAQSAGEGQGSTFTVVLPFTFPGS
ncbi:MAG: ATP-binding protein, partial [candidate division NC10 bacterium]